MLDKSLYRISLKSQWQMLILDKTKKLSGSGELFPMVHDKDIIINSAKKWTDINGLC